MYEEETDIGKGFMLKKWAGGYTITGPAAPQCKSPYEGRCGGYLRADSVVSSGDPPIWKIEQEEPLTLSPSIQCSCGGQHGFVRNGQYE